MAIRGKQSKIKLRGSALKKYCLENMVDKETGLKIPVRVFMVNGWKDIGGAYKSVGTIQRWLYTFDEIINAEPYPGHQVNEKLIYQYNVDIGVIDPEKVPYEAFTRHNYTFRDFNDEDETQERCEKLIFKSPLTDFSDIEYRRKACILTIGEEEFLKMENEIKQDIKKRHEIEWKIEHKKRIKKRRIEKKLREKEKAKLEKLEAKKNAKNNSTRRNEECDSGEICN